MTAICKYKKLTALLCTVLAVFMMMTALVIPAMADEEPTDAEAAEATVAETTTDAGDTTAETKAEASDTTAETKGEEETKSEAEKKEQRTRGIINLVVGAVILIAIVVLAIVFRAKIPVWFKALKSECGKIVWCPKDKLKRNSFVVIIIIVILAVVIGLLDFGFSNGIIQLGKLVTKLKK